MLCACLLSYCCSRWTHTYTELSSSRSHCVQFLFLFVPSVESRSLLAARTRCRRRRHSRRSRVEWSVVRTSVYVHNLVCASRVSIQFSIRLYILRVVCFISFPSTAPAVYIVTDFAVVYVHILYMHMSVCSGWRFFYNRHRERWYCTRSLADWLSVEL